MEIDFVPGLPFTQGRLNVFIAPADMFAAFFNETLNFQRFMTLFVCGNYSLLANRIDRSMSNFDVRRAFTSYQLLTILQENYHTIVILEHDSALYEGDREMRIFLAKALEELSLTSIVILFAPKMDAALSQVLKEVKQLFFYGASGEFIPGPEPFGAHAKKSGKYCRQEILEVCYSDE
jgi:DNA polymerase I